MYFLGELDIIKKHLLLVSQNLKVTCEERWHLE